VDTEVEVSHPSVEVVKRPGMPRGRKVHVHVGDGPNTLYSVHNPTLSNTMRGVVERIFTVDYGNGPQKPYPQSEEGFRSATRHAWRYISRNISDISKYSVDQFIGHYDDARIRRRYQQAFASLAVLPVNRRDSNVKAFVKAEKTNFSAKRDPAPRIISPRDARYNLEVGLFVKPIEGALYKRLNEMCGGTTVMKGLNSVEVGKAVEEIWNSFSNPVAVAFDAKRFDQHTGRAALRFEQRVYAAHYHGGEKDEFKRLLKWQLESRCRSYMDEGVLKYKMGIRASGDMNTGLGTCLIACSLVHSFCVDAKLNYRLINNGDDCVLVLEQCDLHKLDGLFEHCKSAGYHMELEEPVYRMEHIDFCQSHPIPTARGVTMVRQYPESIAKDFVSLLPLTTEEAWKKWANDVGGCGMSLNAGVPILYELYSALRRSGEGTFGDHPWLRGSGMVRNARGLDAKALPITSDARLGFYEAYGVTPDQQVLIEQHWADHTFSFATGLSGYSTKLPTKQTTHYLSQPLYTL